MKKLLSALGAMFIPGLIAVVLTAGLAWPQTQSFESFVLGLNAATAIGNGDSLYINQSGASFKLPGSLLRSPTVDTLNCGQTGVSTCAINITTTGGGTNRINLAGGGIQVANPTSGQPYTLPTTAGIFGQVPTASGVANNPMTWSTPPTQGNIARRFGSLDVCQRGAGNTCSIAVGLATSPLYTMDGCYLNVAAGEGSVVSLVAGLSAPGAASSYKAAQIQRNNGQTGTALIIFGCPLDSEEIALIRGNFVTISAVFSTGPNFSATSLTYILQCGTGVPIKYVAGYTAAQTIANVTVATTPSQSAQRIQGTSSSVVPANCTQAELLFNWNPVGTAGASDLFTIDSLQLENVTGASAAATAFEQITLGEQLLFAQRHFWKTFAYNTAPAQNIGVSTSEYSFAAGQAGAGNEFVYMINPTYMRATPTITIFNPAAANAQIRNETRNQDLSASAGFNTSDRAFGIAGTGSAGTVVGDVLGFHITADSGI
jgi:hypothetical protein